MPDGKSRLVYSTDTVVPRKNNPDRSEPVQGSKVHLRHVIVRLDRKHRGGKSVTVVEGLPIGTNEKEALLKELKISLGTGGTLREQSLEFQGDHCETIMKALEKRGYKPKRSGR